MKITLATLQHRDACSPGLHMFEIFFPDGWEGEWDEWAQAAVISHPILGQYMGWLWAMGIVPAWSMSGANLSSANLSSADLSGATLSGATLCRADLRGADQYVALNYTPEVKNESISND